MRTIRSVGSRWQLWLVQRLRAWAEHDGIVIHERLLNRASIDRLHRLTPTVFVWAVDDLSRALQLLDLGTSGLIVDDLALIAQINLHLSGR